MKRLWILAILLIGGLASTIQAQQYTGISGLVHVPTAEMSPKSNGRIGGHYLYQALTPDKVQFKGKEYNTFSHYVAFSPLSWIELSYTCVFKKGLDNNGKEAFTDRSWFTSAKIRALKETDNWPAIAIGTQNARDYFRKRDFKYYYVNSYVSATKHFDVALGTLGTHLTYRQYENDDAQDQWGGIVGGVTYQPNSVDNLLLSAEYNGDVMIASAQLKMWKYVVFQAILVDGIHFCGGVGLSLPLN